MIIDCQKCGNEGHTQENCILTREPCYKCGKSGHIAGECSQMGRLALRHQIYENPPKVIKPFCQECKEEGHATEDCKMVGSQLKRGELLNKYQEAYKDLRHRDPIASMDETKTEYPSQEYWQIDMMLEERKVKKVILSR